MGKKTGQRRRMTTRDRKVATKDLTAQKRSSVERGEVAGGSKAFMILSSGSDGPLPGRS